MQARRTATAPPGVAQPRTLAAAAGAGPKAPLLFTSPIFYVNAVPHIGHLYTTVLVDTLKRWHDFKGHPTIFCTGTDEHGLKVGMALCRSSLFPVRPDHTIAHAPNRIQIQEAAQAAKMDPKAFCDGISGKFKARYEDHYQAVAHFWNQLKDKGYIYKGFHEGWYCVSDETFYPENQVEPSPDNPKAMISKESGKKVEWTREENYKFRLGAFRERLIEWLEANPQVIVPEGQYNFVLSQLKHGDIGDLSVSRLRSRLQWGIPVPDDPDHVIYVWLDALTNYLTVTGYPWTRALPAETEEQAALRCGWPAHVHVVGKDIVKRVAMTA
nr:methionyl-tRNA synthetase [Polyrhizophydium stewartii]